MIYVLRKLKCWIIFSLPQSIIDFYGDNVDGFLGLGGPGGWNDPDMLVIGDDNSLEKSELGF